MLLQASVGFLSPPIRTGDGYAVAVYTPEQQARTAGEPAHANNAPGVAAAVAGPTAAATTAAPPGAPTLGRRAGLGSLPAERERTTLSLTGPRPETTVVRV